MAGFELGTSWFQTKRSVVPPHDPNLVLGEGYINGLGDLVPHFCAGLESELTRKYKCAAQPHSHGVNMADKGETTTIHFRDIKLVVLRSPYNKGCFLIETKTTGGKYRLVWTKYLTKGNKSGALVWVYSYKSSPPANGTYVVLEFAESGNFIFGQDSALKLGEPNDVDPFDITSPTDPRVFLKGSGSYVMFLWKGFTNDVITLLPSPNARNKSSGPCGLRPEGNGPKESQEFQLNLPILQPMSEETDLLEVVPHLFPEEGQA
ncbi:Carboxylesterase 5A [Branchiostoma belcheri]|nr:Carboxylesterase 5A [Branchiostoma belcheri]